MEPEQNFQVKQGKIRGWGCCNESPYGATRLVATAKAMGATPPCVFQNDYSILNRRCDPSKNSVHTQFVGCAMECFGSGGGPL